MTVASASKVSAVANSIPAIPRVTPNFRNTIGRKQNRAHLGDLRPGKYVADLLDGQMNSAREENIAERIEDAGPEIPNKHCNQKAHHQRTGAMDTALLGRRALRSFSFATRAKAPATRSSIQPAAKRGKRLRSTWPNACAKSNQASARLPSFQRFQSRFRKNR